MNFSKPQWADVSRTFSSHNDASQSYLQSLSHHLILAIPHKKKTDVNHCSNKKNYPEAKSHLFGKNE